MGLSLPDTACLPVLADEKEEAGCTDAELLAHLRGQGRTSAAAGAAPAKGV